MDRQNLSACWLVICILRMCSGLDMTMVDTEVDYKASLVGSPSSTIVVGSLGGLHKAGISPCTYTTRMLNPAEGTESCSASPPELERQTGDTEAGSAVMQWLDTQQDAYRVSRMAG